MPVHRTIQVNEKMVTKVTNLRVFQPTTEEVRRVRSRGNGMSKVGLMLPERVHRRARPLSAFL